VILNLVLAIIVGAVVFQEKISPTAQIGIVLGIISAALIEFG
jgi:drug/metabolite transporter (DMT)-like permease